MNAILKDLGFIHPENKTGKGKVYLFAESRELYPDFYNENRSIVIDAKYKKLQNEEELKREDVYQVVTYMYRLRSKYGVLLYPANKEIMPKSFKMNEKSFGGGESFFIKYGMNIPLETENYKEYTNCFKELEGKLKDYFKNGQF